MMRMIETKVLDIAVQEDGPADGPAVLLLHGFPYGPESFETVAPALAARGCRVVTPFLRGHGPTLYRDAATPRSGQQAAIGADVVALMDAMGIGQAVLAGYDWGGRGACIAAALWPERVAGLVTIGGYAIQDIARTASRPGPAAQEARWWYQYYFHTPRGAAGLEANRREIARLLWGMWSPGWRFDDATFERTAACFDNPDWVATVLHSYRHRFGYVAGDPAYEGLEQRLAARPPIPVPTVVLHGADDGVAPPHESERLDRFTGPVRRAVIPGVGHNMPQERPAPVVDAVMELVGAG